MVILGWRTFIHYFIYFYRICIIYDNRSLEKSKNMNENISI